MGNTECKKEKNVLLLAMSTFNNLLKKNIYEYEYEKNKKIQVDGISQLEPGTKCIIELLKKENKCLDRVVVMNTNATITPVKVELFEEEQKEISPYQFYVERINNYLAERAQGIEFVDINIEDEKLDEVFFLEVAKAISKNYHSEEINLYMDMQGGDRNTAFYMNSIAELLKNQRVKIKKRIAIPYTTRLSEVYQQVEGGITYQIKEVSEKYQSYELLTAMKVFKEYGWGKELVAFFENSKNEADNEVVAAIEDASDAIKTCKVQEFDTAVNKLGKLITKYKDSEKVSPHMKIIIKEIEEDYGVLLKEDVKLRYVAQIRWCLKKEFLQQAISILEAKMPHEYVVSGLRYYCHVSKDDPQKVIDEFKKIHSVIKEKEPKNEYKMKDINHFFIRDMHSFVNYRYPSELQNIDIKYYSDYTYTAPSAEKENRKQKLAKSTKEYRELCNKRNEVAHVATLVDANKIYSFMNQVYGRDTVHEENLSKRIENYLDDFMEMANLVQAPKSVDLE